MRILLACLALATADEKYLCYQCDTDLDKAGMLLKFLLKFLELIHFMEPVLRITQFEKPLTENPRDILRQHPEFCETTSNQTATCESEYGCISSTSK